MHLKSSRPLRSSVFLSTMALALSLIACSSVAAQAPASGTQTPSHSTPPVATNPGSTAPGQSSGGQPGDPNAPISGTPDPNQPIPGDGALHVTPVAGVKDPHPAAIDHISIAPDSKTITVYWYGGVDTCYALSSATAVQDSKGLLVITVKEGVRPTLPPNTACIDIAQLKATTITLDHAIYRDGSQ